MSNNEKKVNNKVKNTEKTKKDKDLRQSNLKLFSVASVVILIAIIVVANVLFENILGDALKFDFSLTGQNTVSQEAETFLKSIPDDQKVRIVGLMDEPSEIYGTPNQYIVPYLDQFAAKSNGKVTVEYINPAKYPSIIRELDPSGVFDLTADTYVVNVNNKNTTIDPMNCFTYDSEALKQGYYSPTSNIVEYTFVNAIKNLSSGYTSKAYFVTGLKNDDSIQLKTIFDGMGIETADLQSSDSFAIPDDCNLLILNGINADISEKIKIEMQDYIKKGGKVIVAVDYNTNNASESYKNLNEVLNLMDLNIDFDIAIERNEKYVTAMSNYGGIEALCNVEDDYVEYASTKLLQTMNPRPVRKYDYNKSYITTTPVLTTTNDAVKASNQAQPGQLNIAMYSTYTGTNTPPEFFVFGTMDFTSDYYIASHGYSDSNVQFIRSCVRSLLNTDADSIEIAPKALDDYSIDTTKATSSTVSTLIIVFMVVIPLGLVIFATIVYNKRKNL